VMSSLRAQTADPFQGAVERRVLAPDLTHIDMEETAAREAIAQAGIDPRSIDLVLTQTLATEVIASNPACTLHHRLGLARECTALQVEGAQFSFPLQLQLAASMIRAGSARCALLIQSAVGSRMIDPTDPISPLFGDGAIAVIVGPVAPGFGLIAAAFEVEGDYDRTMVGTVVGGSYLVDGAPRLRVADPPKLFSLLLRTADICKRGIDRVLAKAQLSTSDIDFVCIHQGTRWMADVVLRHTNLSHARTFETFTTTAHLHGGQLSNKLGSAAKAGVLRSGDLVAMTGGGTGMIYGGVLLRWGTA
jgi:3-oxoacyl-[acyl-carrier-protein] synthase-3